MLRTFGLSLIAAAAQAATLTASSESTVDLAADLASNNLDLNREFAQTETDPVDPEDKAIADNGELDVDASNIIDMSSFWPAKEDVKSKEHRQFDINLDSKKGLKQPNCYNCRFLFEETEIADSNGVITHQVFLKTSCPKSKDGFFFKIVMET